LDLFGDDAFGWCEGPVEAGLPKGTPIGSLPFRVKCGEEGSEGGEDNGEMEDQAEESSSFTTLPVGVAVLGLLETGWVGALGNFADVEEYKVPEDP
jgi:hypothetical protein